MTETVLLTAILIVLVALYFLFAKYRRMAADDHHHDHHEGNDGVCCGRHTVCDKGYDNSNLYFDDEELDRFREREEDSYTDEEAEEFRQVLYTMKEEEVDLWVKCLGTRRIALPQQIKDEIFLMLQ